MGNFTVPLLSVKGSSTITNCCRQDWSKLPNDLLVEVLCKLPDKQLVRCKIVCKLWNDVITQSCIPHNFALVPFGGFIYNTLKLMIPHYVVNYVSYGPSLEHVECLHPVEICSRLLPFELSVHGLIACCNGLLLFVRASKSVSTSTSTLSHLHRSGSSHVGLRSVTQSHPPTGIEFIQDPNIRCYVCNPATRQLVQVPLYSGGQKVLVASLVYDPRKSLHFKLVCFGKALGHLVCYIFSSETCIWDVHVVPFHHPSIMLDWVKYAVYMDGVLYRLAKPRHLVCFDVDHVNAYAIDLPFSLWKGTSLGFIGISRGRLRYSNRDFQYMFFWMLEGRAEEARWVMIHKLCIEELISNPYAGNMWIYSNCEGFTPYALHPTCDIVFIGTPERIYAYHLGSRKMEPICRTERDMRILAGKYSVFPYARSLVNLKSFDTKDCGIRNLWKCMEEIKLFGKPRYERNTNLFKHREI